MANLPVAPESNAEGDVKRVFEEIQRDKRLTFVPSFFKSLKKLRDSNAALESLVAQRTASLRNLSQRLMRMQDEERRRVARDLHDSTGQTLAALKMNVASLQKRFENDPLTSGALADIAGIADQALQEMRTTSYLLHPPLLDEAGLASAARWYVEGFSQRSGIQVNLAFPPGFERLPNDVEMVFFRVLQESLTNVHRHSGASIVDIGIQRSSERVIMEVQDNGHGIAPELLDRLRKTTADSGVGLAGMRERLNELNGQFDVESGSNGTTLRVGLPLASAEELKPSAHVAAPSSPRSAFARASSCFRPSESDL